MASLRNLFAVGCSVVTFGWCPSALAETVTLDVQFRLTDNDYNPLPNVPVRVVFGCDKDWNQANSGVKFTTDSKGEASFTTKVDLDKQWRKMPTNYVSMLLSVRQPKPHLMAAAALNYMNLDALYAIDMINFGGQTLQDRFSLYIADKDGNFTLPIDPRTYGRLHPELKNVVWQGPGFESAGAGLWSTDDPKHWTLNLAFKKSRNPIPL